MRVEKWNFETKEYEIATITDRACLYIDDLDAKVECANCGTEKAYGELFTSKVYHNRFGLGYSVCEDCYTEERKAELAAYQKEEK